MKRDSKVSVNKGEYISIENKRLHKQKTGHLQYPTLSTSHSHSWSHWFQQQSHHQWEIGRSALHWLSVHSLSVQKIEKKIVNRKGCG